MASSRPQYRVLIDDLDVGDVAIICVSDDPNERRRAGNMAHRYAREVEIKLSFRQRGNAVLVRRRDTPIPRPRYRDIMDSMKPGDIEILIVSEDKIKRERMVRSAHEYASSTAIKVSCRQRGNAVLAMRRL